MSTSCFSAGVAEVISPLAMIELLPDKLMSNVLLYLSNTRDFVSLEATSKTLRKVLSEPSHDCWWKHCPRKNGRTQRGCRQRSIQHWRNGDAALHRDWIREERARSDNILLSTLGNAEGFQAILEKICAHPNWPLRRTRPTFRGDSVGVMAGIVQAHVLRLLKKAAIVARLARGGDDDGLDTDDGHGNSQEPIKLDFDDLVLLGRFRRGGTRRQKYWFAGGCPVVVPKKDLRNRLCLRLARRVGIPIVTNDVMRWITDETTDVICELVTHLLPETIRLSRQLPHEAGVDLYNQPPPFIRRRPEGGVQMRGKDEEVACRGGLLECVVVPRLVEKAAERCNLLCVRVYCSPWVTRMGKTVEEEMEEAQARYYPPYAILADQQITASTAGSEHPSFGVRKVARKLVGDGEILDVDRRRATRRGGASTLVDDRVDEYAGREDDGSETIMDEDDEDDSSHYEGDGSLDGFIVPATDEAEDAAGGGSGNSDEEEWESAYEEMSESCGEDSYSLHDDEMSDCCPAMFM